MERESNPMQPMCRSGCGFYGNPATDGLCSVCYRDYLRKKQQPPVTSSSVASPQTACALSSTLSVTDTAQPTVHSLPLNDKKGETSEQVMLEDQSTAKSSSSTNSDCDDKEDEKDAKKKKNRCAECRKKVGLTGFECRCGGLYCALHRYSDKHNCTFDYREHGAQEIRRNNPVVVGEKIQKI